ncbi:hypothetical protein K490DRAFT_56706 [Saccharata proteae CBS 121410]|uniref:Uncharacterized protein n=1 Tax=Saccharata proteae CBS 121410 TaxID=1314787 RepID=A0A9P4HTB0_9PEZI|nr:hypothetical protein K490DRAFT_56706 [Saccharata proteae CBS 121410]
MHLEERDGSGSTQACTQGSANPGTPSIPIANACRSRGRGRRQKEAKGARRLIRRKRTAVVMHAGFNLTISARQRDATTTTTDDNGRRPSCRCGSIRSVEQSDLRSLFLVASTRSLLSSHTATTTVRLYRIDRGPVIARHAVLAAGTRIRFSKSGLARSRRAAPRLCVHVLVERVRERGRERDRERSERAGIRHPRPIRIRILASKPAYAHTSKQDEWQRRHSHLRHTLEMRTR